MVASQSYCACNCRLNIMRNSNFDAMDAKSPQFDSSCVDIQDPNVDRAKMKACAPNSNEIFLLECRAFHAIAEEIATLVISKIGPAADTMP